MRQLAAPASEEAAEQEAARLSGWLAPRRPALRRLRLRTAAAAAVAAALGSLQGAALEELHWTAGNALPPKPRGGPTPLPTAALAGPRLRELRLVASQIVLDAELAGCSALTLLHAQVFEHVRAVRCAAGLSLPPALRELRLRAVAWDAAAAAALAGAAHLTSLALLVRCGSVGSTSSGEISLAAAVARALGGLHTLRRLDVSGLDVVEAPWGALLPLAALSVLEDLSFGTEHDHSWTPSAAGSMAKALLSEPGFGTALTRLELHSFDLPSLPRGLLGAERLCRLELPVCGLVNADEEELEHSLQVCGAPWHRSLSLSECLMLRRRCAPSCQAPLSRPFSGVKEWAHAPTNRPLWINGARLPVRKPAHRALRGRSRLRSAP